VTTTRKRTPSFSRSIFRPIDWEARTISGFGGSNGGAFFDAKDNFMIAVLYQKLPKKTPPFSYKPNQLPL
jgi:hypothetical protein